MSSTIRAITARSDRPDDIVAAGEVLDLRFRPGHKTLSLQAGKMLHALIKFAGARACDDVEHRIPLADLRTDGLRHFGADEVIEVIRELVATVVELRVRTPSGKDRVLVDPLLHGVNRPLREDLDAPDSAIAFRLSATLRRVLGESSHWGLLSRRVLLSFESRYALRLFEVISLRVGLVHKASEVFPLADLRARLGVPDGTFRLWADLRRYVIERAVVEINHVSGLVVGYEAVKRGKAVTAVKLS
jgi:Initiator Replication protein